MGVWLRGITPTEQIAQFRTGQGHIYAALLVLFAIMPWAANWWLERLVPGITNRCCSPSFETATEPVIGRAFARPVGGLLRMRSNLLKHSNLMLRSERRERLEAWAASDSPISHSQH